MIQGPRGFGVKVGLSLFISGFETRLTTEETDKGLFTR